MMKQKQLGLGESRGSCKERLTLKGSFPGLSTPLLYLLWFLHEQVSSREREATQLLTTHRFATTCPAPGNKTVS